MCFHSAIEPGVRRRATEDGSSGWAAGARDGARAHRLTDRDEHRDDRHGVDGGVLGVEAAAAILEDDDGERLVEPLVAPAAEDGLRALLLSGGRAWLGVGVGVGVGVGIGVGLG